MLGEQVSGMGSGASHAARLSSSSAAGLSAASRSNATVHDAATVRSAPGRVGSVAQHPTSLGQPAAQGSR